VVSIPSTQRPLIGNSRIGSALSLNAFAQLTQCQNTQEKSCRVCRREKGYHDAIGAGLARFRDNIGIQKIAHRDG